MGSDQAILGTVFQFLGLSKSSTDKVLAMGKDVDYLPMAKPVAFNHLGIHYGCASSSVMRPTVGSSL